LLGILRDVTPMLRNILCPFDFTTFSHAALDRAVAIARAHGAAVTALHVLAATPAHNEVPSTAASEYLRTMEAQLLKVLREADAPCPRAIAVAGDPALEIEKLASRLPADLVVMPRHGWTGLVTHTCGAVTEHVLCHARAPIIVVPESTKQFTPESDGKFHRILCGIDFSPASLRALRYAGALASADCGQLVLSHVVSGSGSASTMLADRDAHHANNGLEVWRRRLHSAAAIDIPPAVTVQERVQVGNPAAEILQLARDEQADLVAIGGHRGHPPGCVMSSVVTAASCPVLIVRVCDRTG
jgi:nucleotide-binding universal stress UspA family protein